MRAYNPRQYSFEDAAHLLRRAGFGATVAETEKFRALGPMLAVEKLLDFSEDDGTSNNPFDVGKALQMVAGNNVGPGLKALQAKWLHNMVYTTQPLKEKLALFWHGHFVTSIVKVRQPFDVEVQYWLFKKMGLGNFADLTLAVAKDPAMLRYLDNDKNTKDHPNENFARELMELFCMGVGNYTEKDIQESARAFSGWTTKKTDRSDAASEFVFRHQQHDAGTKTFLGQSGNFEGQDIVQIIVKHQATPKHVLKKIWAFFVNEKIPENVSQELVAVWQKTNGNMREILRAVFTSQDFYASENRLALIKSPIEFVVGTLRSLSAQLQAGHIVGLLAQLEGMYQVPFAPPDVSGWDMGDGWISDTSLLNRLNFVAQVVNEKMAGGGKNFPVQSPAKFLWPSATNPNDLQETLDNLGQTFLGEKPSGVLLQSLKLFSNSYANNASNNSNLSRKLAYLMLASPQYHLA